MKGKVFFTVLATLLLTLSGCALGREAERGAREAREKATAVAETTALAPPAEPEAVIEKPVVQTVIVEKERIVEKVVTATPILATPTPPLLLKGTIYFQGLLENRPWSIYKLNVETGKIELVVENAEEQDVHKGKLVFRRWDGAAFDLWFFSGGSEQKIIDNKPGILLHYPRWSPDGQKIVFETDCSDHEKCSAEKTGIELVSADGKNREIVLSDPNCDLPTWDGGQHILLRTFYGDSLQNGLERLDIKTGKREIVAEGVSVNFFDVLGDSIAYSARGSQKGGEILILEKGRSWRIGGEVGSWPAWSPDGKWLAFNHYGETSYLIIEPVGMASDAGKTFTISGYATRPVWVWE